MDDPVIGNFQASARVNVPGLAKFANRLRKTLALGRRSFGVSLVNDRVIRRLNAKFRGKRKATDVLSFPSHSKNGGGKYELAPGELRSYLGEIVISAEAARRNAKAEGHSLANEVRWLILHGALHLMGYDHEKDHGEMNSLELRLRDVLGITERRKRGVKRRALQRTKQK